MDEEEPQEQPQQFNIVMQPEQLAGVWANWGRVSHSLHEFTLDFVRMDYSGNAPGIVVARVSVSPLFITQLIDALQTNWQAYAERALPKEARDGTEEGEGDRGGG